MTPTLASPTTEKIINDFIAVYPNVKHVIYDTISSDAALNAFEKHYGTRASGRLRLFKSQNGMCIDADF